MFPYKFTVVDISEGNEVGFKAIVPSFPHLYIVADSLEELHQVVQALVNEEIELLQKKNKPIPMPDSAEKFTGIFSLRIKPALHKRVSELAKAKNRSLNSFVSETLEKYISS